MYVSRTDSAYIYRKWNDGLHIILLQKATVLDYQAAITLKYIQTTERRKREREREREREIMSIRDLHIFLLFCTSIWLKRHQMLRNRLICFYKFKMCEWFNLMVFILFILEKKICHRQSHFPVQFGTFRNPNRFSECFSNWLAVNGQRLVQKEIWIY